MSARAADLRWSRNTECPTEKKYYLADLPAQICEQAH
jgi:hypothetical protein